MKTRNRSAYYKEWYAKNRERIIAKSRAWELAHPERAEKNKQEYVNRHPDRRKATVIAYVHKPEVKAAKVAKRKLSPELRSLEKKCRDNYRETLADVYVRRVAAQKLGIKGSELPQTLVDAKRVQLKLQRLIKERQNENFR